MFAKGLVKHRIGQRYATFIPAHTWVTHPEHKNDPNPKGHKANWIKFARSLTQRNPSLKLLLVDLRNHGDTTQLQAADNDVGPNTVEECSKDIVRLCCHLNLHPHFIVGHSFGGKVASTLSQSLFDIDRAPQQVWILDSLINLVAWQSQVNKDSEIPILKLLQYLQTELVVPVPSLHALAESMQEKGFTKEMALWMTTNLRKTHEGFVWKFNLPGVRELLEDYFTTELWQYLSKPPPGMEVHFVRAEKSERWTEEVLSKFSLAINESKNRTHLHLLRNSGHWVNVDNPEGLIQIFEENLYKPPPSAE